MKSNFSKKRHPARFTFLEVLVASCIIGISLTVILSGFSQNMVDARTAQDYIDAVELAKTKMDILLAQPKMVEIDQSGTQGRIKWASRIKATADGKDWQIRVECAFVTGEKSRVFRLDTLVNNLEPPKKEQGKKRVPDFAPASTGS